MSYFYEKSWVRFAHDPLLADWIAHALPTARAAVTAPENAAWLRCGGTWFVGVNALANTADGRVGNGPKLAGKAMDFISNELNLPGIALDRGQISICFSGYPQRSEADSDAAFRFRRERDAAHLDGLLAEGPERRRHLREHHGFVLGIPMVEADRDAAPLVVWEGSHEIVREAFSKLFADFLPEEWGGLDVTNAYQAARKKVFKTCRRVEVSAKPGEAYLVHRLAIHGVAPWGEKAKAGPDGRMIVYFRPELENPTDWLAAP